MQVSVQYSARSIKTISYQEGFVPRATSKVAIQLQACR
jgi:hypothetical protein